MNKSKLKFIVKTCCQSSLSVAIATLGVISSQVAQAEPVADRTTGTNVTNNGNQFDIDGGTRAGENLFHSFEKFGLTREQTANFLSNPDISNILGRVTGGDASFINGLIQVTGGNSNLYLINPAGIVFGNDATLNLPASFTATTANGIQLGDFWFDALGENNYEQLLDSPNGFAFATDESGTILNSGNLKVNAGETIALLGGLVINTGTIDAAGGKVDIASVPGKQLVTITPEGALLSLALPTDVEGQLSRGAVGLTPTDLPTLLTGGEESAATDVEIADDGSIRLTATDTIIANEPGAIANSGNIVASTVNTSGVDVVGIDGNEKSENEIGDTVEIAEEDAEASAESSEAESGNEEDTSEDNAEAEAETTAEDDNEVIVEDNTEPEIEAVDGEVTSEEVAEEEVTSEENSEDDDAISEDNQDTDGDSEAADDTDDDGETNSDDDIESVDNSDTDETDANEIESFSDNDSIDVDGTTSTSVETSTDGNTIAISGETVSEGNLFHSFSKFDLESGKTANFVSQAEINNILARVTGDNPSLIDGTIEVTEANSNLFFINPAGIVFGSNSTLNLPASFTASTASSFVGAPDPLGAIINAGDINVGDGETINLVGGSVVNTGDLQAPAGNINLAALNSEQLDQIGESDLIDPSFSSLATDSGSVNPLTLKELVENSAASLTSGLETNGDFLTLSGNNIQIPQNSETVIASGNLDVSGENAGKINILGDNVGIINNAEINASGTNSGGDVTLGGDGEAASIFESSTRFVFDNTSSLDVGSETGSGGSIKVTADRGIFDGQVVLSAANGNKGSLTIDPARIEIVKGTGADDGELDDGAILAADGNDDAVFTVSVDALQDGKVVLEASESIDFTQDTLVDLNGENPKIISALLNSEENIDNPPNVDIPVFEDLTLRVDPQDGQTGSINIEGSFAVSNQLTIENTNGDIIINPTLPDLISSNSGGFDISNSPDNGGIFVGIDTLLTGVSPTRAEINNSSSATIKAPQGLVKLDRGIALNAGTDLTIEAQRLDASGTTTLGNFNSSGSPESSQQTSSDAEIILQGLGIFPEPQEYSIGVLYYGGRLDNDSSFQKLLSDLIDFDDFNLGNENNGNLVFKDRNGNQVTLNNDDKSFVDENNKPIIFNSDDEPFLDTLTDLDGDLVFNNLRDENGNINPTLLDNLLIEDPDPAPQVNLTVQNGQTRTETIDGDESIVSNINIILPSGETFNVGEFNRDTESGVASISRFERISTDGSIGGGNASIGNPSFIIGTNPGNQGTGDDNNAGGNQGTGGDTNVGGNPGTGGDNNAGGGNPGTGGDNTVGGNPGAGGDNNAGGGNPGTGGDNNAGGGNPGAGGDNNAGGGNPGAGGDNNVGGNPGTGGDNNAGGGNPGTGGDNTVGGNPGTGGDNNAGGGNPGTGGDNTPGGNPGTGGDTVGGNPGAGGDNNAGGGNPGTGGDNTAGGGNPGAGGDNTPGGNPGAGGDNNAGGGNPGTGGDNNAGGGNPGTGGDNNAGGGNPGTGGDNNAGGGNPGAGGDNNAGGGNPGTGGDNTVGGNPGTGGDNTSGGDNNPNSETPSTDEDGSIFVGDEIDIDGDGVTDGVDTDGDGIADGNGIPIDTNGDGITDGIDTDGDGATDGVPIDTDGDGITNGIDTDGDGNVDGTPVDTDGDGIADGINTDGGDDIADGEGVDTDGDGIADGVDTDGDGTIDGGLPDGGDDIADGEGVDTDGTPVDTDGDGVTDGVDTDGDGIADGEGVPIDTDGDGISDDIDTDGDGAADGVPIDTDGDGIADGVDTDGDGIADGTPVDTDGDSIADGVDTDGDGIADGGIDGDGIADGEGVDIDGDGIADGEGVDTDGDGVADGVDTDGDGVADEDIDSEDGETIAEGDTDAESDGNNSEDDSENNDSENEDEDSDDSEDNLGESDIRSVLASFCRGKIKLTPIAGTDKVKATCKGQALAFVFTQPKDANGNPVPINPSQFPELLTGDEILEIDDTTSWLFLNPQDEAGNPIQFSFNPDL